MSAWCSPAAHVAADAAGDVVATFNGGAVTRADLESVLTQKLPFERDHLMGAGGVHDVLESLVRYDLLVLEAEARGYRDDLRVRDAAQAKANELLIQERASVDPQDISAAEIKRVFEEQRREFSRPQMRRASHVLLRTRAEAQALIGELKGQSRERFARVASERSQDPNTRKQGGELGYFDREGKTERGADVLAPPQLVAAAFQLRRVGDITPQPVELADGFSVLMLTGEMKAVQASPAQVDERIREQLVKQKSSANLDAFMAELRAKYQPVVHESLVDLAVIPPPEPAQIPAGFPAAPPDPREAPKVIEPDGY